MYSNKILTLISLLAAAGLIAGSILALQSTAQPVVTLPPVHTDELVLPPPLDSEQQFTGASEAPMTETTSQTKFNGYTLQLSGDTLYVYYKGEVEPTESHTISARWLPEYDRILLQNGLYVATTAELRQLLEDYIS